MAINMTYFDVLSKTPARQHVEQLSYDGHMINGHDNSSYMKTMTCCMNRFYLLTTYLVGMIP